MEKSIVFSKFGAEEPSELQDEKLKKFLQDNYDFVEAFIPEGYDMAFLCLEEDSNTVLKDKFKVVFFRKTSVKSNKTITLDNIDEMEDGEEEYTELRCIEGSFEDAIDVASDILKKHYEEVKGKFSNAK